METRTWARFGEIWAAPCLRFGCSSIESTSHPRAPCSSALLRAIVVSQDRFHKLNRIGQQPVRRFALGLQIIDPMDHCLCIGHLHRSNIAGSTPLAPLLIKVRRVQEPSSLGRVSKRVWSFAPVNMRVPTKHALIDDVGDIAMSLEEHLLYYEQREAECRRKAAEAGDKATAYVHREFANMYAGILAEWRSAIHRQGYH